ncbi:DUF488 family protein [uncultured Pseudacidovorax sp.]|uniref:DUF488 domain-containing protein n=1 Tax=uncultured Pseudacidovorax sp. TaxID=679313 RepID=UPI0025FEDE39|nr:DUF488 domain-containing protein [uncultured Pseudacidovorax sp.]
MLEVFTVGHSTQPIERFIALLKRHDVSAIADVRSAPYSRHNPQFNREKLRESLKQQSISYVFLGKELGARSEDECCYVHNKVSYQCLADTDLFKSGIKRVLRGARSYRVALMCAEKDPLDCHRTILVARKLVKDGVTVSHILQTGALEPHDAAMNRLVNQLGIVEDDMFRPREEALDLAYDKQAQLIAYDRGATPQRRPLMAENRDEAR